MCSRDTIASRGGICQCKVNRVRAGVAEMVVDLGFLCSESGKGQGLSEVERVGDLNES